MDPAEFQLLGQLANTPDMAGVAAELRAKMGAAGVMREPNALAKLLIWCRSPPKLRTLALQVQGLPRGTTKATLQGWIPYATVADVTLAESKQVRRHHRKCAAEIQLPNQDLFLEALCELMFKRVAGGHLIAIPMNIDAEGATNNDDDDSDGPSLPAPLGRNDVWSDIDGLPSAPFVSRHDELTAMAASDPSSSFPKAPC